jgi:rhamnosyl/mannosyltransferase
MKVLHFSKFYPPEPGGIELFAFDLIEQLATEVTCDVLCANTSNKTVIEKRKTYTIVRAASLGSLFSTSIAPATIGLLKKSGKEYDLIHLHLPNPLANLAYFMIRPGAKLVLHWHSDILKQKKLLLFYKPLQDWLLKRADLIIATSENYLEHSEYLQKYRRKCIVVPLGLNPDRLLVNENKSREIKKQFNDKPIVFSLGRLIYYKGLKYLIDAMKDVNAYLLIGGTGPLQEETQDQIKKSNLTEKVFLLSRIREGDLGAYYQACDVFCLPSIYKTEAFGLVQVEAMYFGKPVVSTDITGSGVSWVNQHNATGLVVPPQNSKALAAALTKIISDSDLKARLGRNGRERFEREFTMRTVADRILKVYEDLLNDY